MAIVLSVRVSTTHQPHMPTIAPPLERRHTSVAATPEWHLTEEHSDRDAGDRGANLNRPGVDGWRDRAAMAACERGLMTAPERLARHDVPHVLRLDARAPRGGQGEGVNRPMRQAPHAPRLLQIRGAVAADDRPFIAERLRRGRQATGRRGARLPWTVAPDESGLEPARPRDPQRLRLDPVQAAVVAQLVAWSMDAHAPATLDRVATRRTAAQSPTRRGTPRGHVASGRGLLCSPGSMGTADSGRTRPAPARVRPSAWRPVGPGQTRRPAPPEEWLPLPVPAMVSEESRPSPVRTHYPPGPPAPHGP